ncbi:GntR family transcriptional regulator [Maribacter sp. R77961]|uniref:GntR family transcriptional regulator n=1 Tax=Maribacter sp. R77961 TaxID=3093871 RepID=UPI0037C97D2F
MNYSSEELTERAYTQIKKLIVTKKLTPGETIFQERLCETLGVQMEAVKNALALLANESILVPSPLGRMQVREISTREILETYDCRIALEAKATELFTLFAPQERIDDLRNLMVPFENGTCNANVFHKIDRHFHYLIVKNCGNRKLYELYKQGNFLSNMELIGLIAISQQEVIQEHLDIISAIHQRDSKKASQLMARHIERSKEAFYQN